jgi:hypothetical protein
LPPELYKRIFSFLSERDQQNLTLVNKFWSVCIIDAATNKQITKIREFIFNLNNELKIKILDQNKDAYEEAIDNLANISSRLFNDALINRSNLCLFKQSTYHLQGSIIAVLKVLSGLEQLDRHTGSFSFAARELFKVFQKTNERSGNPPGFVFNVNNPLTPLPQFLFDDVIELAFLHHEYEKIKINKGRFSLEQLCDAFADENDFKTAIEAAKGIPHNEEMLYRIVSHALKKNQLP